MYTYDWFCGPWSHIRETFASQENMFGFQLYIQLYIFILIWTKRKVKKMDKSFWKKITRVFSGLQTLLEP